jgi:hypothetical protein
VYCGLANCPEFVPTEPQLVISVRVKSGVVVVEDEDEDELPKLLSFPENPQPDKYIKIGSK